MKKKYYIGFILIFLVFSCEYEYENAIITDEIPSDLVFSIFSFQSVSTISTYAETTQKLKIIRTRGLSKELEVIIEQDSELLATFNAASNTNFSILPGEFLSYPTSLTFPAHQKEIEFDVVFSTKALFNHAGESNASSFVLPLKIGAVSGGNFVLNEAQTNILLNIQFSKPTLEVDVPPDPLTLSFISGVNVAQNLMIESSANFTTVDVTEISFESDASYVNVYNMENGTNFVLLPDENYSHVGSTFDADDRLLLSTLSFDCSELDPSHTYLLPLKMKTMTDYQIVQHVPIYVIIELTEILVSIEHAGLLQKTVTSKASYRGDISVSLNAAILDDVSIIFNFDASYITLYNQEHGTDYQSISPDLIAINPSQISAESRTTSVDFSVDLSAIEINNNNIYLIPLILQEDHLLEGSRVQGENLILLELTRTIVGKYTPSEGFGYIGASTKIAPSKNLAEGQYMIEAWGSFDWPTYFNLKSDHFDDNPDLFKLEFTNLLNAYYAPFTKDHSYLNIQTGEVVIDLTWHNPWLDPPVESTGVRFNNQKYLD